MSVTCTVNKLLYKGGAPTFNIKCDWRDPGMRKANRNKNQSFYDDVTCGSFANYRKQLFLDSSSKSHKKDGRTEFLSAKCNEECLRGDKKIVPCY